MIQARLLFLLPVLLGLAACDETRFEVDPLGEARVCEPALAGTWRIEDDGDGAPEFVAVGADCDLRLLRPARGGEGGIDAATGSRMPIELSPSIGRVGGALYLSLTDEDFHRAAEDAAGDTGHPASPGGFHLYRLELRGDAARLRTIDHQAVARAIVDGRLRGEVRKDDDGLKNLLRLDAAAARELLGERWLFRRDDPLRLTRVPRDALPAGIRAQAGDAP